MIYSGACYVHLDTTMKQHASDTTFDLGYTWGLPPSSYLATRQIARLTILRSRLDDRSTLRNRHAHMSVEA